MLTSCEDELVLNNFLSILAKDIENCPQNFVNFQRFSTPYPEVAYKRQRLPEITTKMTCASCAFSL